MKESVLSSSENEVVPAELLGLPPGTRMWSLAAPTIWMVLLLFL